MQEVKRGPDLVFTLGVLSGILGGLWLIVWPFISWPLGSGFPALINYDKSGEATRDIIYGVLLILFTLGCAYGMRIAKPVFDISLYGFLLLSIFILASPFIFGNAPGSKGFNDVIFWQDIITGAISLVITLYYIIPRPKRA